MKNSELLSLWTKMQITYYQLPSNQRANMDDKNAHTLPQYDIKMITDDINAKISPESHFLHTIGKHFLHNEIIENLEFLINFDPRKRCV